MILNFLFMKHCYKISLLAFYFFNSFFLISQNLVPNPSFESYTLCPDNPDQINYATDWNAFSESPDYFNTCSPNIMLDVPNNFAGYQQPITGNAYAGIATYQYSVNEFREIIGCALVSPLINGQKYFVNFKVVNAGLGSFGTNCCSNNIGARFSNILYSASNPPPINNIAQIYTDSIIEDTLAWQTIAGSFVADSNYQFLAIGNFFQDVNTNTLTFNTNGCLAYYYIDDVCVSTDSAFAATWTSIKKYREDENSLRAYPNPTSGIIHLVYEEKSTSLFATYNSIGEQVFPEMIVTKNYIELNFNELNEGVYFFQIQTEEKRITKRIIHIKQ